MLIFHEKMTDYADHSVKLDGLRASQKVVIKLSMAPKWWAAVQSVTK